MWGLTNALNESRYMPPAALPACEVPAIQVPVEVAIEIEPLKTSAPAPMRVVPLEVARQVLAEAIAAHEKTGRAVEVAWLAFEVAQAQSR